MNNREKEVKLSDELSFDNQLVLIKHMIETPSVFETLAATIDQNQFSESALRKIAGITVDYFNKTGSVPTYETIELKIGPADKSIGTNNDLDVLYKIKNLKSNIDASEVIEKAKRVFMILQIVKISNSMKKDVDSNRFKSPENILIKYEEVINDVLRGTPDKDIDLNSHDTIFEILSTPLNERIDIGIAGLEIAGIPKGGLSLFTATYGKGKTTFATEVAYNVATTGRKVLQMNCEDGGKVIVKKHISKMLNIPYSEVARRADQTEEMEKLTKDTMNSKLFRQWVKNFKVWEIEREKTGPEEIRSKLLTKYINKGFYPDLLIIDYFSCLKMSSNPIKKSWEAENSCLSKLENIAKEFNIAILVMEQTNRSGLSDKSGAAIQGSFAKNQIAWTIFRLFTNPDTKEVEFIIDKERGGTHSGDEYRGIIIDYERCFHDFTKSDYIPANQVSEQYQETKDIVNSNFEI